MAIVQASPQSVWGCPIVAALRAKGSPEDGAVEKAAAFIEAATPLVDLIISGPFREYTLHNRDHSKKLLHLAGHLISPNTLGNLSPLEHLVIIYSAYLHDMGMCLTDTERRRILVSEEFLDSMQDWPELWDALTNARSALQSAPENDRLLLERTLFELHEAGLAAYLRPRHAHALRYRQLISTLKTQANRPDLFEYRGVSFEDNLIDICVSHNLDSSVLAEVAGPYHERFPREIALGGAYLNSQFCAALLRLSDVLDFDRERTPRILFDSLGILGRSLPGAELTIHEWQKHLAVHTIELNRDEIVISADSQHPVVEKAIREFCQIIEREVRDTAAVLKRNTAEVAGRYGLELPLSVRAHVRSVGYVFKDLSLTLNQPRITALLMGERLYSQPAVAARELLQNSIDACSARLNLEGERYQPDLSLAVVDDSFGRWIEVSDNGIGMDEHVISEFFLELGNSYYESPEFGRLVRNSARTKSRFVPISRFGIGIISVFGVGDVLEVITRAAHSPRGDSLTRRLRIEKLGALAFVTESDSGSDGTRVRVRLRSKYADQAEPFLTNLESYLRRIVVRPRFPIKINILDRPSVLEYRTSIKLRPNAREVLASKNVEYAILDIGRWSDRFSGTIVLLFAKTAEGRLSHMQDGKYLRIGASGIDPLTFLLNFSGNRVTVNGFAMTLKKTSQIVGVGRSRIAMVLDVDIRGDEDVQYDISRERIVGSGRNVVVSALEEAIFNGLNDTGVLSRLDAKTRVLVDVGARRKNRELRNLRFLKEGRGESLRPGDSEEILEKVQDLIPRGLWPIGLHRTIAQQLSISNGLAYRAITTLVATGKISNASAESADLLPGADGPA